MGPNSLATEADWLCAAELVLEAWGERGDETTGGRERVCIYNVYIYRGTVCSFHIHRRLELKIAHICTCTRNSHVWIR